MTTTRPAASSSSWLRSREAQKAAAIRVTSEKRLSLGTASAVGTSAPVVPAETWLGGCVIVAIRDTTDIREPQQLTARQAHGTHRQTARRDDARGEDRATQHGRGLARRH